MPPDTGHVCSKVVPYDPFPCPSCAAKDARIAELEADLAALRTENERLREAELIILKEDVMMNHITSYARDALLAAIGMERGPWTKEKEDELHKAEKAEAGLSALRAENERLREVAEAAKECSKQYFYFETDYDDVEFYGAMERLYAALKKLEEG